MRDVCCVCVTNNTPRRTVLLSCDALYEMMKSDKSDETVQATPTTVYKLSETLHLLLKKDGHSSCHILKVIQIGRFQDKPVSFLDRGD